MNRTALCIAATFFGGSVAADEARYAVAMPEASFLTEIDKTFLEGVASASDLEFTTFFDSTFGGFDETFDLVSQGAVQMGAIVTGYHPSQLPLFGAANALPAVFPDGRAAVEAARTLAEEPAVKAELKRSGLVPVLYRPLPQYRIMCTDPVAELADLRGKKVRTYGAYIPRLFEALGAVPVDVALPEFYEALERGTVDCGYFTYALFEQFKIHEVAPYISDLEFGAINGYTVFANAAWWNALSDETRGHLETAAQAAEGMGFDLIEAAEDEALAAMLDDDGTLVEFEEKEAFYAALPDTVAMWSEATRTDGVEETAAILRVASE